MTGISWRLAVVAVTATIAAVGVAVALETAFETSDVWVTGPAHIERVVGSASDRQLTVEVLVSVDPSCSKFDGVEIVQESSSKVRIRATEKNRASPEGVPCLLAATVHPSTVELGSPLGTRVVEDDSNGAIVPVSPR